MKNTPPEPAPLSEEGLDFAAGEDTWWAIQQMVSELRSHDNNVPAMARNMARTGSAEHIVLAIDYLQKLTATARTLEATLAWNLGRYAWENRDLMQGSVPGARYEVHGGKTRKTWDHDAWKRDARNVVVDQAQVADDVPVGNVAQVLTDDGELVPVNLARVLQDAMAALQEFHGATAPRTGTLKKNGLDPDDYCESTSGPFTITITPDAEAGPKLLDTDTAPVDEKD